ncbi:RNA methyltransferase [Rheinheimera sp.]|uniref:RNA methyltransferase n=1 Tax=Rheinheimera sp. TaxID=1869214 RepID=UPI00261AF95B|nr:RNA methyltransferase [Rheinheimera sp.]MCA1930487.1 RNA methyltransferase [Rheinheimera sp.]
MISQKWSKLIRSLQQKKYRKAEQLFFVEGEKSVLELLHSSWKVRAVFGTEAFLQHHHSLCVKADLVQQCTEHELVQVGTFSSNNAALAVAEIPVSHAFKEQAEEWVLVLDQINDPGNLGTIIRVADWYGIRHILCSPDTVDLYNPKVIAAAKGSFLRVQMYYQELLPVLKQSTMPVYGAYLEGESVHQLKLSKAGGYLVMGNEANGISPALKPVITHPVTIPAFGDTESLNVGIATAILCDNLKRLSAS